MKDNTSVVIIYIVMGITVVYLNFYRDSSKPIVPTKPSLERLVDVEFANYVHKRTIRYCHELNSNRWSKYDIKMLDTILWEYIELKELNNFKGNKNEYQ